VIEVILGLPICVLAMAGAFSLQGGLLLIDEFYFHRRRGLGLWERVGHPIDNLLLFFPLVFAFFRGPESDAARWIYFGFSALSCLLITKDEWVHTRECGASENWLHALLFVLHPVALGAAAWAWIQAGASFRVALIGGSLPGKIFAGQLILMVLFFGYQVLAGLGLGKFAYPSPARVAHDLHA
jgi:hypothetical protein